ncbi:sigma-70 family RNA polymerase sigma factor [Limibacter armeniacum]|uniref:RNA polymerase sigma factor n=1 Tax=Limibacter armeniacum TaxID=466084 RepID=UPI002FE50611
MKLGKMQSTNSTSTQSMATSTDVQEIARQQEAKVWLDFLNGDENAITQLYELFAKKLYNYGKQLTSSHDLVMDCIQDVFVTLIHSRENLSKVASVRGYLYVSFRRMILKKIQQNSRMVLTDQISDSQGFMFDLKPEMMTINNLFSHQQHKLIRSACNKLPVRQREALSLYFFEEMSYKEIAETMGFEKVKSVRTTIYRALEKLSDMLSIHEEELRIS